MKKDYRRVLVYGLIMLACVVVIVIIGVLSDNKIEGYENDYQKLVETSQNSIRILEEDLAVLKKENKDLKEKIEKVMTLEGDVATLGQAFADLREIFEEYRDGNVDEARKRFEKIEPMGFDDKTLCYYEALKELFEK